MSAEEILLKPKTVLDRYDEEWVNRLIDEGKGEAKRSSKTPEEEDAEERRLLALGAAQAKKLNIKPQDAERNVHDYRNTAKRKA